MTFQPPQHARVTGVMNSASVKTVVSKPAGRRVSLFERLWFGGLILFYVFGAGICVFFFATSLKGSGLGKALFRVLTVTWLLCIHALVMARWKSFRLRCDESPLDTLRAPRPTERDELAVWRWTRVCAWAAAVWIGLVLIAILLGRLGLL